MRGGAQEVISVAERGQRDANKTERRDVGSVLISAVFSAENSRAARTLTVGEVTGEGGVGSVTGLRAGSVTARGSFKPPQLETVKSPKCASRRCCSRAESDGGRGAQTAAENAHLQPETRPLPTPPHRSEDPLSVRVCHCDCSVDVWMAAG